MDTYTSDSSNPSIKQAYTSDSSNPSIKQAYTSDSSNPSIKQAYTSDSSNPSIKQAYTSDSSNPSIKQAYTSNFSDLSYQQAYIINFVLENKKLHVNKDTIAKSKKLIKLFTNTDGRIHSQYKKEIIINSFDLIVNVSILHDILKIIDIDCSLLESYISQNNEKLFDILYVGYYLKYQYLIDITSLQIRNILATSEKEIRNTFKFDNNIDESLKEKLKNTIFYWN